MKVETLLTFPHISYVLLMIQRITIEEIRNDPWFQVNYIPARQNAEEEVNLDDVRAAFDDIEVRFLPLGLFHSILQYFRAFLCIHMLIILAASYSS